MTRAKAGDPDIDYRALRFAFAAKPDFNPYGKAGAEHRAAMMKAYSAGDCATAVKEAVEFFEASFGSIDGHIVSDICNGRLRNDAERARHHAIAAGLIHSITDFGDGKSQETAYVVISVDEEYSLLGVLGLNLGRQSLIKAEGHMFDQLDVTTTDGQPRSLLFNIDRVFAAYGNMFKQKQPQPPKP